MKGLVICFWVVKMRWCTLSHRLSPVADGDTSAACLHLICVHWRVCESVRNREATALMARCKGSRVKRGLKLNHFQDAAVHIV